MLNSIALFFAVACFTIATSIIACEIYVAIRKRVLRASRRERFRVAGRIARRLHHGSREQMLRDFNI